MKGNRKTRRTARKLFRLCLVDGALDEARVRQVAQSIAGSRQRGVLSILANFQRMVRIDRRRHTARVESAEPLADPLRDQIRTNLARVYGTGIEASFEQNPALIGGMRITVDCDVYDDSVRARLAALEARL